MDFSTPGLHVFHHLLELGKTHVHWVSDAIQPSHPLSRGYNSTNICMPEIYIYTNKTVSLHIHLPNPSSISYFLFVCHLPINLFIFCLFSSVAQSCLTLCDSIHCSTPGLPVHHQLLEFTQTHVQWVSDAIQPSHPLSSPFPPTFTFLSIRVFSNESVLHNRRPKYWSFNFNISPSNEHSVLISFRIDWLNLLTVQRTLKTLLQLHSSKASILRHSAFFIVQLSHPYMTTGKTIALTRQNFVGKVMSLLFNMLSRLVITFFPRSKHLLILWLQSPSAVILEPPKKACHCFHCFPICLPWSDETGCHDLSFLNVEL